MCAEQPGPRQEAIGTEAGGLLGPCACLHAWTEPIFLAFTLTTPPPLVPTPSLGPEHQGSKASSSVTASVCPNGPGSFLSPDYISQLRNVQGSSCPPSKASLHFPLGFYPRCCWKGLSSLVSSFGWFLPGAGLSWGESVIISILRMRKQRLSRGYIICPESHSGYEAKPRACGHIHLKLPLTPPLSTAPDKCPSPPAMNPQ